MYTTYILFSPSLNRFYIGSTSNLGQRPEQHRQGLAHFTKQADDWELVFRESFTLQRDALALERKIKSAKSRKSVMRYIQNPRNQFVVS